MVQPESKSAARAAMPQATRDRRVRPEMVNESGCSIPSKVRLHAPGGKYRNEAAPGAEVVSRMSSQASAAYSAAGGGGLSAMTMTGFIWRSSAIGRWQAI
jgi:hypothetical protein